MKFPSGMQGLTQNIIQALSELLSTARKVCIVVHTHPDGDAIGSGLAFMHYLREVQGKDACLVIPDEAPSTLSFLTSGEDIINAKTETERASRAISESGLIALLDLNEMHRCEAALPFVEKSEAPRLLIDHHAKPCTEGFDLAISRPNASSTCEILFFVLKALENGSMERIPAKALYSLMTGLTTDTNNFANSVGDSTLQVAGELIGAGVDRDDILGHLYHEDRPERLRANCDLAANHLTILPCGLAYIILTEEMSKAYGLLPGETDGLVNLPLSVKEVVVSIFLHEENGLFRVSIRSKRGWSARRIAEDHFHGGGHEMASGGKLRWPEDIASPDCAAAYIESIAARFLPNYKAVLQ